MSWAIPYCIKPTSTRETHFVLFVYKITENSEKCRQVLHKAQDDLQYCLVGLQSEDIQFTVKYLHL